MSWNPKVHYRIHKCPPPVPILSLLDPIHTPTSHFRKIHLNIILPSTPGSPKSSVTTPHPNLSYVSQYFVRGIFLIWVSVLFTCFVRNLVTVLVITLIQNLFLFPTEPINQHRCQIWFRLALSYSLCSRSK